MKSSILFSVAAASTAYAAVVVESRQASNWTVGQTVKTTSGSVAGHAALNQTEVSEYLGIPFAQPPVADLRFEAPVKYTGNTELSGLSYLAQLDLQRGLLVCECVDEAANWGTEEGGLGVDIRCYRLSILGFPGNPNGTANVALLDQRMAIEWVRDNIENFGGDKSRITIFGQSAGGVSVDLYSYAYSSDPIAAGFIPESGTVFSWGLPNTKAAAASATGTAGILGYFGPTVDNTIVFSNYTGRTPANVPVLLGNNDYEAGLFRVQFGLNNLTLPDRFWNAFDLQEFTCPAGIRANVSAAAKIPTWRYRYLGVWDNTALSPQSGAYHGAEIPVLFNTAPTNPPASEEYVAVGNYMRGAWAAFAKDPVEGLTKYGWPSYSSTSDSLVRLAYQNMTGTNAVNPSLLFGDSGVCHSKPNTFKHTLKYAVIYRECSTNCKYQCRNKILGIFKRGAHGGCNAGGRLTRSVREELE
ncbi:putative Acetylcholinesterase 1 [Glarea lozoyensis 74030]|uniref:Carboxylic ester hydrolase n=1 Tax=Glarea lozoyensis (strain ATCC 74030 / MF5533) TaxID=1104152 RepID=H0ELW3_GLAL7|nr:putative Acetylcholinesterase 1 [Glarea lozoyensis 74030]